MEVRPGPSARVRHELTDSCLSVGLVTRVRRCPDWYRHITTLARDCCMIG